MGNYRVDRFMRWLAADGFYVVLVRAGSVTGQCTESLGGEGILKDPLGFYRYRVVGEKAQWIRKSNKHYIGMGGLPAL